MSDRPVEPVPAATVILVRSTPCGGWECFMVRRHVRSDFAADVFVFPGGKVDPGDNDPGLRPYLDDADAGSGEDTQATGTHIAALRELFEEAGVLLARHADGTPLDLSGPERERFEEYRDAVHGGRMTLEDVARAEELRLQVSALAPFSRWITPEVFPRRFDTYFFVALLPAGQEPLHDAVETTEGVWISPRDALQKHEENRFPLVFATEEHLRRMARYPSIEALVSGVQPRDLEPVLPRIVQRNGETLFLLPGDEGY